MSASEQALPGPDLRLGFVEQVPLFRGLSRAQCVEVAARARERRVQRRQSFFREGEPASETCVLYSGRVKLTQLSAAGDEVILRLVAPAEAFGALGVPLGGSHKDTAAALEPSQALAWERRTLEELFDRFPVLHRNALRIVAERLRSLEERYRELATERVPQRLAQTLLRLVGQIGRPAEKGALIALSREDLAQMMGTTLFTVSRLLSLWEESGILDARREAVLVYDPPKLVAIAEASAQPNLPD